jgi:DNA-binding NarL/FixJ family response regulator
MATGLMAQRVLRDVEVVARAGLDIDSFLEEALDSVNRAVPHVASCMATVDPSTLLLTGTRKFGLLRGVDSHDHDWGLVEYGTSEPSAFRNLGLGEHPAVGMELLESRSGERSSRMDDFMKPNFGFTDELRVVFRDRGQVWGGAALFRDGTGSPQHFDEDDVRFLASLSSIMSVGMRSGLLASFAVEPTTVPSGPAVVIVAADGSVQQMSAGADQRLEQLVGSATPLEAAGVITSLVGAARRYARGEAALPPRCRVRSRSGMWLVLHATPLSARGDTYGDVVVTIDEARPPEIVPLVVAAFDLTQRERDVTQLVLQGVDTKEIAATLHVSTYTVQDHLKSVFEKAGVRSRRELIARIYFDQYVPRMGTDIGPSGWFAGV